MYDNKNRAIILFLIATLVLSLFTVYIYSEGLPGVSAKSAALYEPETKSFLYNKEANLKLPMASTTKIMTALLALERLSPNEPVTVDSRAVGIEGSSIYLKAGETMNALDLVYAVLLQSANDAAAALAYKISDTVEEFAALMNERARELGAVDTSFKNPHGLDEAEHYTTAHDLAVIAAAALENEDFKNVSSTYKKEIDSSDKTRLVVNHNKMLKMYDGCIGVKTGYTKKSGRCLVSAAERDGLTLICVTIDAPDDWRDHTSLLNYGYSLLEAKTLAAEGEFSYKIPVLCGESDFVTVSNKEGLKRIFKKGESDYETHVKLSKYLAAPIKRGDILGEVLFTLDGEELARLRLTAENDVNIPKKKKRFFNLFNIKGF